jgi:hypothetical protein
VDWSGAALSLCLQHRVTVSWIDGCGEPAGHLWPRRTRPEELAGLLNALTADDLTWPEAYGNWLRRRRLHVLHEWRHHRELAYFAVTPGEWQAAKQAFVYRGQVPELLPRLLHVPATALVVARMAETGLQLHYWTTMDPGLALAEDLTNLVWAEMNLCAGPLAAAIEEPRLAASLFEQWAGTCTGIVNAHLASLRAQALRHRDD